MDSTGQTLAYVYGHADQVAKALTLDEARRIASNIAKLPASAKGIDASASMEKGHAQCRLTLPMLLRVSV